MANRFVNFIGEIKPVIIMVLVQGIVAMVNIFYKLAVIDGMSLRILIAYRFIFATACVLPLALIFERKSRPKLTWTIVFLGTLCGLLGGSLSQNLMIESLALTSATFATAIANLIPALTFILTILFRLESLSIRKISGIAKLVGTLVSIVGAMILILYKGREVNIWSTNINLIKENTNHIEPAHHMFSNHILGSLLALAGCLCYAFWYIFQAKLVERYPCKYSSTSLFCISASIQSTIYAVCTEKDWSAWKLGWNVRLLTVVYTGAVATGLMAAVTAWCVLLKGPLFVSVFNPLSLVYVALVGSLVLKEKLHLGSLVGSVLIITGLYIVLWGKGKELKKKIQMAADLASKSSKSKASESLELEVVVITMLGDDHQVNDRAVFPIDHDEDDQRAAGELPGANPRHT